MKQVWEKCNKGYENAVLKEYHSEWTHEQFLNWLANHCGKCPYYSGYHCAYGDYYVQ